LIRVKCGLLSMHPLDQMFDPVKEWGPQGVWGGHLSGPLRGNFCSASKFSAALWSKTAARCLAFSSGHVSTVDSVPSGAIRTTCHPKALASYRSRFILRICAPSGRFSSPEVCHNTTHRPDIDLDCAEFLKLSSDHINERPRKTLGFETPSREI